MVEFDREKQGVSDFSVRYTAHQDGFRCVLERGGNVSLSGGPFKTQKSAEEWARRVAVGLLRLALEAVPPAELEGERPCIHCGHLEGEHRIDGNCATTTVVYARDLTPWGPERCPCTWFDPALEAPGAEVLR